MNTNYYRNESWIDSTFSKRGKCVLTLLVVVFFVGIVAGGCGFLQNIGGAKEDVSTPVATSDEGQAMPAVQEEANVPAKDKKVDMDVASDQASSMVSYDVTTIGRADPFMPSDEIAAFEYARNSAIAEANAHNAEIAKIKNLQGKSIRELDDISPYSFNLPVPPTSLASSSSAAAKITRTKVVGIMYNSSNPSAIINVDDKDYLVRQGDKIIGQEYKVVQINPNWITVGMGSNIYSASIGELFSREDFNRTQNDLYNLKNRFGGRKG